MPEDVAEEAEGCLRELQKELDQARDLGPAGSLPEHQQAVQTVKDFYEKYPWVLADSSASESGSEEDDQEDVDEAADPDPPHESDGGWGPKPKSVMRTCATLPAAPAPKKARKEKDHAEPRAKSAHTFGKRLPAVAKATVEKMKSIFKKKKKKEASPGGKESPPSSVQHHQNGGPADCNTPETKYGIPPHGPLFRLGMGLELEVPEAFVGVGTKTRFRPAGRPAFVTPQPKKSTAPEAEEAEESSGEEAWSAETESAGTEPAPYAGFISPPRIVRGMVPESVFDAKDRNGIQWLIDAALDKVKRGQEGDAERERRKKRKMLENRASQQKPRHRRLDRLSSSPSPPERKRSMDETDLSDQENEEPPRKRHNSCHNDGNGELAEAKAQIPKSGKRKIEDEAENGDHDNNEPPRRRRRLCRKNGEPVNPTRREWPTASEKTAKDSATSLAANKSFPPAASQPSGHMPHGQAKPRVPRVDYMSLKPRYVEGSAVPEQVRQKKLAKGRAALAKKNENEKMLSAGRRA